VAIGGGDFIPGFAEQVEGMTAGEKKDIEVTFPADYGSAALAGKTAVFAITAKGLKKRTLPAWTTSSPSGSAWRTWRRCGPASPRTCSGSMTGLARMGVKRQLLDQLAEKAAFEVPQGMVEGEFGQIWQRVEADMKAGRLDEDDKGKDEETLKGEYRAIAERRIRLGLLLSEIGRTNNIQVSNEELSRAMQMEASRYPGQEKQVVEFFRKNPGAIDNLRAPIFEEKVVDFVLELAKVTEVPARRRS
jgi:trigger factor